MFSAWQWTFVVLSEFWSDKYLLFSDLFFFVQPSNTKHHQNGGNINSEGTLTDGIFETGAYGVPSKSQNPIILGQVVHLAPNVQTLAGHAVGTIRLVPAITFHFNTVHKTKHPFSNWIF